ncbi:MAG: 6-phosphofructokinase [Myxococcota bacterium]
MKTFAMLTSGGDAPGMNTALAAAVKVAAEAGAQSLGVRDGYRGLLRDQLIPLAPRDVDAYWQRGGTELGTARCPEFHDLDARKTAAAHLIQRGVDGLLVIGGNGSLAGAAALQALIPDIPIVGIPASIDNDLGCTSMALGVDTALNTIVQACDRISDTARSHRRIFIVEVMGRDCGYLAMASALAARADAIITREQNKPLEQLVEELGAIAKAANHRGKKRVLIIKAEGARVPLTELVAHLAGDHGFAVRTTVLGHMVRGGSPSFRDRLIAGRLAFAAVRCLLDNQRGMVGWEPVEDGGAPTHDPAIQRFSFARVLEETQALLSGTHPSTIRRLRLLDVGQRVLPM